MQRTDNDDCLYLSTRALSIKYCALYVSFIAYLTFSRKLSLFPAAAVFFILLILFFSEYQGTRYLIAKRTLLQRTIFLFSSVIPLNKIKRISFGEPYGITQQRCFNYFYEADDGSTKYKILILDTFDSSDLREFISKLSRNAPQMEVDPTVKAWLSSLDQTNGFSDLDILKKILKVFFIALFIVGILAAIAFTIQVLGIPVQGISNLQN